MIFSEARFIVFFAVVFGLHWALRSQRARKTWLLVASYAFYAAWDVRFLALIVASTVVDFAAGRAMARSNERSTRRLWMAASLVCNLGLLGFFKYYDFFAESAVAFSTWLGLPLDLALLQVVLPVGISFYTFQTLSYTIDVYRNKLPPTRSPLDFALFVAFFPQLVAGPIVRASTFLPQLVRPVRFADVRVRACLLLFLVGWVKKACLSDQVAVVVDPIFAAPASHAAADLWLGAVLYAVQIYGDFSGYSDMAIATAGLLGYALPVNFAAPYLATSVRDFWRRWHISLSTWFRDYLFIPLGGSRVGPGRTALNLLVVFTLCGLWHGAAWTFVIWGLFHGVFLGLERRLDVGRLPGVVARSYTLLVVLVGWVLFRAESLDGALEYLAGMAGAGSAASAGVDLRWWLLVAGTLALQWMLSAARRRADDPLALPRVPLPDIAFAFAYGVVVALLLPWAATGYRPFIYFQF